MSSSIRKWKTSESAELLRTRVFKVTEHEASLDEKSGKFVVLNMPDWINIIAETEEGEEATEEANQQTEPTTKMSYQEYKKLQNQIHKKVE